MLRYSRTTPFKNIPTVVDHVRSHLSAVATPDDNPDQLAAAVRIDLRDQPDEMVLVLGELDAEPAATYLEPGFYPDQEAAANPLTVSSIQDQP